VLFDEEFIGGRSLQGLCSQFRGRLLSWSSVLCVSTCPDYARSSHTQRKDKLRMGNDPSDLKKEMGKVPELKNGGTPATSYTVPRLPPAGAKAINIDDLLKSAVNSSPTRILSAGNTTVINSEALKQKPDVSILARSTIIDMPITQPISPARGNRGLSNTITPSPGEETLTHIHEPKITIDVSNLAKPATQSILGLSLQSENPHEKPTIPQPLVEISRQSASRELELTRKLKERVKKLKNDRPAAEKERATESTVVQLSIPQPLVEISRQTASRELELTRKLKERVEKLKNDRPAAEKERATESTVVQLSIPQPPKVVALQTASRELELTRKLKERVEKLKNDRPAAEKERATESSVEAVELNEVENTSIPNTPGLDSLSTAPIVANAKRMIPASVLLRSKPSGMKKAPIDASG
jgi:hypothetical protein